jgi:hypothetical protein
LKSLERLPLDRPANDRVTTFLENLEMSGILVIVREMSGIMIKVGEMSENFTMSGKWAPLY